MKYIKNLRIKNNQLSIINDNIIEIDKLELSDSISKELVLKYKKVFIISNNFLSFLIVNHLNILSDNDKKTIMKKIISNPELSYKHAVLIKKRFLEGEKIILTDPILCSSYAESVIRGRWIEAEPIIASNGLAALNYSINLLKKSWYDSENIDLKIKQKAENNIIRDSDIDNLMRYALLKNKRWIDVENVDKKTSLTIEKKIATEGNPEILIRYINKLIGKRWKEAELNIAGYPEFVYLYAKTILKQPWSKVKDMNPTIIEKAENSILNPESFQENTIIKYFRDIIKSRWKKLEDVLILNRNDNLYFDAIDEYYNIIIKDQEWPEMDQYANEMYDINDD
jgi:hypothetical protein